MDLSISQVPIWLSILFSISFSTIPIFLIANTVKKVLGKNGAQLCKKIILFYWVYFILIGLVSLTGFFTVNALPPRIIITTALPLLLFYLFYVQKTTWFKHLYRHIKLEQIIYIHLFRFVGIFFILTCLYDALPIEFALIGGIGDIVSATLAIPVIYALKKGKSYAKKIAFIWNIIGLADITSVIISATQATKVAIENDSYGVTEFGTFPFSWIPAFAPATIIFLHILVFKKLSTK